jgi:hypothetical protein
MPMPEVGLAVSVSPEVKYTLNKLSYQPEYVAKPGHSE